MESKDHVQIHDALQNAKLAGVTRKDKDRIMIHAEAAEDQALEAAVAEANQTLEDAIPKHWPEKPNIDHLRSAIENAEQFAPMSDSALITRARKLLPR